MRNDTGEKGNDKKTGKGERQEVYTCSMHPEVKADKPGKCPLCGMDLIKKKENVKSA